VSNTNNNSINGFAFLGREVKRRFTEPVGRVNFWGYLFLAIILLGGLPIYIEAFRLKLGIVSDAEGVILALFTVFPAIMGASAVQLVLDRDNSPIRMAGLTSLIICTVATVIFISDVLKLSDTFSIVSGIFFCVLAVLIWWIANGLDPIFQDTIRTDDSVGGDVNQELGGDFNGFQA
jgi:hypothetical protein